MTIAAKQSEDQRTSITTSDDRRHELGQFLTPDPVADFMASLFESRWQEWNLLDAGAGSGALSAALTW
jgi:predicted RNA methylase